MAAPRPPFGRGAGGVGFGIDTDRSLGELERHRQGDCRERGAGAPQKVLALRRLSQYLRESH